jgi:hypothetical protein
MVTELTEVDGISKNFADNFREEGFYSAEDIAEATEDELTEVNRVGSSRAGNILEAAEDVAEDSEDFDLTEDAEDVEEEETDSEATESVSEDSDTELTYQFENERQYEVFKYVLVKGILGTSNPHIDDIYDSVLEQQDGSYKIIVELSQDAENNLRNHLANNKRFFQNERETEYKNLMVDVIEEM